MKRPALLNTRKRPAARAVGRFVFLMWYLRPRADEIK